MTRVELDSGSGVDPETRIMSDQPIRVVAPGSARDIRGAGTRRVVAMIDEDAPLVVESSGQIKAERTSKNTRGTVIVRGPEGSARLSGPGESSTQGSTASGTTPSTGGTSTTTSSVSGTSAADVGVQNENTGATVNQSSGLSSGQFAQLLEATQDDNQQQNQQGGGDTIMGMDPKMVALGAVGLGAAYVALN